MESHALYQCLSSAASGKSVKIDRSVLHSVGWVMDDFKIMTGRYTPSVLSLSFFPALLSIPIPMGSLPYRGGIVFQGVSLLPLYPPQRLVQWGNGEKTGKSARETPAPFVSLLLSSRALYFSPLPIPHFTGKTKETSAEERALVTPRSMWARALYSW